MKETNLEITYISESQTKICIGDICFMVESAFGEIPMDEIMTDYVAEQVKEHDTADHAA